FERRIRTHVRFEMPGLEERERIWQVQVHPSKTPLARDVDFRVLAERYPASGGDIKNAVIKAAVSAAAEPGADAVKRIHQRHLERGMEEVMAAANVMQQSLFVPETEETIVWRRVALLAIGIASVALIAALVAIGIVLFR
ncbi:MAG TPA: hypothetical protein VEO74_01155, partial [Thermoanaerobaculia bacterium]|nr:hypothetical protein [Thermoanaerobaculia bacterium]